MSICKSLAALPQVSSSITGSSLKSVFTPISAVSVHCLTIYGFFLVATFWQDASAKPVVDAAAPLLAATPVLQSTLKIEVPKELSKSRSFASWHSL